MGRNTQSNLSECTLRARTSACSPVRTHIPLTETEKGWDWDCPGATPHSILGRQGKTEYLCLGLPKPTMKAAEGRSLCRLRHGTNTEPANPMGPGATTAVSWAKKNECHPQHLGLWPRLKGQQGPDEGGRWMALSRVGHSSNGMFNPCAGCWQEGLPLLPPPLPAVDPHCHGPVPAWGLEPPQLKPLPVPRSCTHSLQRMTLLSR